MKNDNWLVEMFESGCAVVETVAEVDAITDASREKRPVCSRCNGTGRVSYFSHVKGGECFRCHGTGR